MHRKRPPDSRSGLIEGHTSLQRSRSYTGCRSSTVSPSKLRLSCIRLSTIEAMHVVPLWPYRVCFGRLECTPTSLLHDSSRCRQTKQDAVRKSCLLSGQPRHMEQPPCHHMYRRLPPSLPSCPRGTFVSLSIWQLIGRSFTSVMWYDVMIIGKS